MELTVDAHHHLLDPDARRYPWLESATMAPLRRAHTEADLRRHTGPGVATVLVQTVASAEETAAFLDIAGNSTTVAGVVGWADLTADPLRLPHHPALVGLRHQVEDEPDPRWLSRADVRRSLAALGQHRRHSQPGQPGLVYDLLVRAPQRRAALECVRALPSVPFVLDHAGKPAIADGEWEPWASWLAALAASPNVSCKLSGLVTEAPWGTWDTELLRPYVEHILTTFGPHRVMFGSDWPVCDLAGGYPALRRLCHQLLDPLSPEERADVLGGCARRVYRLPQPPAPDDG